MISVHPRAPQKATTCFNSNTTDYRLHSRSTSSRPAEKNRESHREQAMTSETRKRPRTPEPSRKRDDDRRKRRQ